MELWIITGMSGAGKSHALRKLEDMGYHCVDNLPLPLLPAFVSVLGKSSEAHGAVCIDCRDSLSLTGLWDGIAKLRTDGVRVTLLFLDAPDDVLLRRYSETRRNHPLSREGLVTEGLQAERRLLLPLLQVADHYIDTGSMKPAELSAALDAIARADLEDSIVLIQSFGYKRGLPHESDYVLDMRFLPNPFWVEGLRKLSGHDKPVQDYVLQFEEARLFVEETAQIIRRLLPLYHREGKNRLTVSVGCTGGRHRSVTMADAIGKRLQELEVPVRVFHRDTPDPRAAKEGV